MKLKRLITPFVICLSLLTSCENTNNVTEEKTLVIATCEENLKTSAYFLKQFAIKSKDTKIEVNVYDCNSFKYKAHHGKLDADIILMDDLTTVNRVSDSLMDFTHSEELGNYSRYVKNFLKNSDDGKVYCLPSPGGLYAYAVNLDLIEKCNLLLPNTMDELIDFSNEIKEYAIPFVSSFPDEKYYLDAFMQTSIPSFFSTVNGENAFDELCSGKTKLSESKYASSFSDSLGYLYNLTVSSFFDKKVDYSEGIEKFFNSEAAVISFIPGFEFEEYYEAYNCTFNYAFVPLIGRKASNSWVCSISDSYATVLKKKYVGNKRKIIDSFLSLFSSSEGQEYLLEDENGVRRLHHFSYVNNDLIADKTEHNEMLVEAISQGRVFLIDKLYPTFLPSLSSFEEYALDKINTRTVIDDIDNNNEARLSENSRYYNVPFLNDSEESVATFTNNLRIISGGIKSQMNLDVLFIDESFLLEPIYDSLIYEHELSLIFDSSVRCTEVKVTGKVLKEILDFCFDEQGNSSGKNREGSFEKYYKDQENVALTFKEAISLDSSSFFTNGASITGTDATKKYVLSNNSEINDNRIYFVAVPTSFVRGGEFEFMETGSSFSCLDAFKEYLEVNRQ